MVRRKITAKQLRALARGRKTAAANRRAKKKVGVKAHPRTTRKKAPMRRANPAGNYSVIRLSAPSDKNGNPRRLFLVLKPRGIVEAIIDEEYMGIGALPQKYKNFYGALTIDVTASQYNWLIRQARKENPAYGNFMNAIAANERGGLGRAAYQNPTARDYGRTSLPYIIGSIDPRNKSRMVFWGSFGWGPESKAVLFPDVKSARKTTAKMKRTAVITLPGTQHSILRETITTGKVSSGYE